MILRLLIALLLIPSLSLAGQGMGPGPGVGRTYSSSLLSVSENFDDYTNLYSIDTLHGWVHSNAPDGAYADARSVSDQAQGTASRRSLAYWGADTFAADQKACMTVKVTGVAGPVVRMQSGTGRTGYSAYISTSNYAIFKNGSSLQTSAVAQTADDVVCIRATGTSTTTVVISVNGTDQVTATDSSSPITSGQPGLELYGNIYYGDDWTAEEL